ncbi:MAG: hypothetical protein KGL94_05275 [Acidobacteriota bacterium]|nr:hypothetical protein [Acidobacteriota bacterium]
MFRRALVAAVVVLALAASAAAAVLQAAAGTNQSVLTHTLVVAVEKNLPLAAEKKLAVLVLISRNGAAPAGAVATPNKPLTVLLDDGGLYRVKAEIDVSCKGSCEATVRISGSAAHKLEVVPSCRFRSSGFVCSKIEIVKAY